MQYRSFLADLQKFTKIWVRILGSDRNLKYLAESVIQHRWLIQELDRGLVLKHPILEALKQFFREYWALQQRS